ncbi:8-amino-7-oxononanoate synthase [Curvibacter sp. PAE-UM]|uniref:8-amino-7-oxononanoate synthase n=1 Tax=Curvibacter sp. PAE-UM TaxID=1714344 RepID=UPI00070ABC31|nr:8-amino-7-oxononanoate synthase [Curvibacter sp. PAE-UM]KRH98930.1 8-amino-7-oxononanoate synthase [Curvibacter sp. PAE-UM]
MSFAPITTLQEQIEQLDTQGLRRRRRTTETACAPNLMLDGQRVLSFNSNDYLGLAADARIAAALQEGVSLYGAGSGASHLVSGHSKAHEELEERLAAFEAPHLEQARALYLSTGYMANLAVLTALAAATPGEAEIFSDALNHASIIDGTRLARAKITVYPHCDVAALEAALSTSTAKTKIVVTDSVFSMDGDIAPLPALLALCERFGAWLVVDDAHGFGVLGEHGRGALEHFKLRSPQLVYMGTLGKAAGVSGAFVAAHETVIDWLVQRARPYIYTTAAAPALAHALLTSINIIDSREGQQRRAQLELLQHQLAGMPVRADWKHLASATPIQPLIIGGNAEVMAAAQALEAQGLWVSAIRAPTVPVGTARLRFTLSAAHTHDDVARLLAALGQLAQEA